MKLIQMFDIDKLYIMRNQLIRGKDGKWTEPKPGTRAYRDNLIIATQLAVLQSEQVQQQLFTPGNFDVPKMNGYLVAYIKQEVSKGEKTAREVWDEAMKERAKRGDADFTDWCKKQTKASSNLIFNYTQVLFHKQNMTAGKLIGIFAQANVSHGFISLGDNTNLIIDEGLGFRIDNTDVEGDFPIDQVYTRDGKVRISNNLAAHLAASVDAVKDPILNLMNVNEHTANVVTSMLRMGFRIQTVALFASLPVLCELVKDYAMKNAEGRVSMEALIETKMKEILDKEDPGLKDIDAQITTDLLIDNLDGHDNLIAYLTLQIFQKMLAVANAFGDITHMTKYNSITAAVGPFATDTMLLRAKRNAFFNNPMISAGIKAACENPILAAFRDDADDIEQQLLGKNLIQALQHMNDAMIKAAEMLGYEKGLPKKLTGAFSDFYMSYYVNASEDTGALFDLSIENREKMLRDFPTEFEAIKEEFPDNILVNSIVRVENKREQYPFLQLKTRGLSSETLEDLKQAWVSLATSENPAAQGLAAKLIEYNFFRGGFGFSPKTFMSLVPNYIKRTLMKDYIDVINNQSSKLNDSHPETTERMIKQFILHNPKYIKLVAQDISKYEPDDLGDGTIMINKLTDDKKSPDIKTQEVGSIIKIGNDIYSVVDNTRTTLTLLKVDHLGGEGQGFEISLTEDFPKSIFSQEKKSKGGKFDSLEDSQAFKESDLRQAYYELFEEKEIEELLNKNTNAAIDALNKRAKDANVNLFIRKSSKNKGMISNILDSLEGENVDFEKVLKGAVSLSEIINPC